MFCVESSVNETEFVYYNFYRQQVEYMDLQQRSSGILLPIFSLPGTMGTGTMGRYARSFADFLARAGQSWWQLLPVNPVDACHSPYSSSSAYAGEPMYIDLEELMEENLLDAEDLSPGWIADHSTQSSVRTDRVYYDLVLEPRRKARRKAFERFRSGIGGEKYRRQEAAFLHDNTFWLDDYAFFRSFSDEWKTCSWSTWPEPFRHWSSFRQGLPWQTALEEAFEAVYQQSESETRRSFVERIAERRAYYIFEQLVFDVQWCQLKKYCNDRGIHLLGDVPIYVGLSGADTWSHPELFQLDSEGNMLRVAGVPGDSFNGDCQRWDMPLYDWVRHEETGFDWWCRRIGHTMEWFDALRLDHFIGFYNYYSFPAEEETASALPGLSDEPIEPIPESEPDVVDSDDPDQRVYAKGWQAGPQEKLFDVLFAKYPQERFIAEDLGVMNAGVHRLRKHYSLPGMNVLQFCFDHKGRTNPLDEWITNSVACTGTHDTPTLLDWLATLEKTGPSHWDPSNFAHVWHILSQYQKAEEKVAMDFGTGTEDYLPEYDFWRYSNVSDEERKHASGQTCELPGIPEFDVPVRPDVAALCRGAVRAVMESKSNTALFPMQDILGLGASSRMNFPGSNHGNWLWRLACEQVTPEVADFLAEMTVEARRSVCDKKNTPNE